MKPINDKDFHFELSSGYKFYAFAHVLGLDDGDLCYGFDGHVYEMDGRFTPDERKEIADYMIEQWRDWAYK